MPVRKAKKAKRAKKARTAPNKKTPNVKPVRKTAKSEYQRPSHPKKGEVQPLRKDGESSPLRNRNDYEPWDEVKQNTIAFIKRGLKRSEIISRVCTIRRQTEMDFDARGNVIEQPTPRMASWLAEFDAFYDEQIERLENE